MFKIKSVNKANPENFYIWVHFKDGGYRDREFVTLQEAESNVSSVLSKDASSLENYNVFITEIREVKVKMVLAVAKLEFAGFVNV